MTRSTEKKREAKVNGWANRSTWSVALWLQNDEFLYRSLISHFRRAPISPAAVENFVKESFREFTGRVDQTPDSLPLGPVNWREIARMTKESLS